MPSFIHGLKVSVSCWGFIWSGDRSPDSAEKHKGPGSDPRHRARTLADGGSSRHVGKLHSKRCAELVRLVVDRRICVVSVAAVVLVASDRSDSSGLAAHGSSPFSRPPVAHESVTRHSRHRAAASLQRSPVVSAGRREPEMGTNVFSCPRT